MAYQRGERQTARTKRAIIDGLIALLREKGYQVITIQDVVARANIGRSTFYRYFATKADIVVAMHDAIFARVQLMPTTAAEWLAAEPPPSLGETLRQFQQPGISPFYFAGQLGEDADYVLQQIDELLAKAVEAALHRAFDEAVSGVPFAILARAIAGSYTWLARYGIDDPQRPAPAQMARYIHRLQRAMIVDALGLGR